MKDVRRLARDRRARAAVGLFVIEGATLLNVALDRRWPMDEVYVAGAAPDDVLERCTRLGVTVTTVEPAALERMATTVTPQPVIGVARMPEAGEAASLAAACRSPAPFVLVPVSIADPGNAGTMLRSAEAAGVGAVLFTGGSVDVYAPKVVRASAGSLFHVPVSDSGDAVKSLQAIGHAGLRRVAAVHTAATPYHDVDLTGPVALVVGSEAHGLDPSLPVDDEVHVPMAGRAESLNAAMAATVVAFEAVRQRGGPGPEATS